MNGTTRSPWQHVGGGVVVVKLFQTTFLFSYTDPVSGPHSQHLALRWGWRHTWSWIQEQGQP